MSDVECAVCVNETDGRAEGRADAAALGDHIVFEPTNQPHARCFLDDDEAQATSERRTRPVDVRRGRAILCMRPRVGLHTLSVSNFPDKPDVAGSATASATYFFDCKISCKVSQRRNYTAIRCNVDA